MNMYADREIKVSLNEKGGTRYEKTHPIEIIGIGSGNQIFGLTLKEANSLCDQLVKATCLCSLRQHLPVIPAEPNPYVQQWHDIYVKAGKVDTARDGGTLKYEGWDNRAYFEDHRIGSKTKGAIYDRYPGDKGAILLTDARIIHCCAVSKDDLKQPLI
jgi:hypothetical protein